MEYDTAGDPMTGLKWTRKTTKKIARELGKLGIKVSSKTVARILKKLGYSLRVNHKKLSSGSSPNRNAQFEQIASQRVSFAERGSPVISVDTKKKKLVGQFKNPGAAWNKQPIQVNDHDFRSQGLDMAAPYDIAAAVMAIEPGPGNTSCSISATATASRSPSLTTLRVPRSGILLSTVCSARSVKTGRAVLSIAMPLFDITLAQRRPPPG
ncbi:MAG: hypothetical protein GY854_29360 [Deltaproteobacteria bacterium]|nr:hypothetical protein [Deltaproteobacteria bacterium]